MLSAGVNGPQRRPLETAVVGDALVITILREFDSGNSHQDWAHGVQVMHPGPFARVRIDLSQCGLLSSTFFAGLIQFHQYYGAQGIPPITLHKPDPRVVRNLKALRLDALFEVVPR